MIDVIPSFELEVSCEGLDRENRKDGSKKTDLRNMIDMGLVGQLVFRVQSTTTNYISELKTNCNLSCSNSAYKSQNHKIPF